MKDYYAILGIDESATPEEIKIAYRGLMKTWHPDVCTRSDAKEKFVEIVQAYEILNDRHRRQAYDDSRETNNDKFEKPALTTGGCFIAVLLIVLSLCFIAYIAYKVYTTLHGLNRAS